MENTETNKAETGTHELIVLGKYAIDKYDEKTIYLSLKDDEGTGDNAVPITEADLDKIYNA